MKVLSSSLGMINGLCFSYTLLLAIYLHFVAIQKTSNDIFTAVRASNLKLLSTMPRIEDCRIQLVSANSTQLNFIIQLMLWLVFTAVSRQRQTSRF